MKTRNLLLLGIFGVVAYFLFFKKPATVVGTVGQIYPSTSKGTAQYLSGMGYASTSKIGGELISAGTNILSGFLSSLVKSGLGFFDKNPVNSAGLQQNLSAIVDLSKQEPEDFYSGIAEAYSIPYTAETLSPEPDLGVYYA
jgi:hypothetical protein